MPTRVNGPVRPLASLQSVEPPNCANCTPTNLHSDDFYVSPQSALGLYNY